MRAMILSIGDELILGQTIDTNSAWLSQQLATIGVEVAAHMTVSDAQDSIEQAIGEAVGRYDVLLISGGIGPTPDDLTRQALAAVMGVPLETSTLWLDRLSRFFADRGREMPEINKIQAMIPRGARMIENTAGTAAGIDAVVGSEWGGSEGGRVAPTAMSSTPSPAHSPPPTSATTRVFVMPGVPKEMKLMFARDVMPHLLASSGGGAILSRTLHTFGLGESAIAEKLGDLMRRDRNPSVGTTVSGGVVSLRVNSRFDSGARALEELERTVEACRAVMGTLIYGQDEETLPLVVGRLLGSSPGALDVATAESGTGGLLGAMLSELRESSKFLHGGWISHTPNALGEMMGVPAEILSRHGAVSEPVASEMARAARRRAGSDLGLAIAGPDATAAPEKLGEACIALDHAAGTTSRRFNLFGDSAMIRDRAAKMALTVLRFHLIGLPLPF